VKKESKETERGNANATAGEKYTFFPIMRKTRERPRQKKKPSPSYNIGRVARRGKRGVVGDHKRSGSDYGVGKAKTVTEGIPSHIVDDSKKGGKKPKVL